VRNGIEEENLKPNILVVDDSLTVRMDLSEAFEAAGFQSTLCSTMSEARNALAKSLFSLIILDVLLPDGDGIEVLREIRNSEVAASTPVMLLSSEAEVRDRVRGLKTGADEYVGKPYDQSYVVARAKELLRNRERANGRAKPATILIIDDSPTFCEALKSALESAGHSVVTAQTGEDGLRVAFDTRPAAIVVDGVLPGIDGVTVIRRIRADAALRRTPCLLLTASEERSGELNALDAGADAYVRKEEDIEIILARVAAVLRSASASSAIGSTSSLLGPKKILAVDDSLTYLEEVAANLREEGYDVVPARSGEEALELLAVQSVDCILLDLVMPGLSGQETCRRIKSSAKWRDIPLIMHTAVETQGSMIEGINAGADDYISKSSDFEVLCARVRAQLRRKQFEEENRNIREQLLQKEVEVVAANAARDLAQARAAFVEELERKNGELEERTAELEVAKKEGEAFSDSVVRAKEEIERASKFKDQFLSTMSHELRTPLNAVLGFSDLLTDERYGPLNERQQRYINHIQTGGKHLLTLINDILDLSKIEAGRLQLAITDVGIDTSFAEACDVLHPLVSKKSHTLVKHPAPGLNVRADATRFKQILMNLIGNAIKFTPEGGKIEIEANKVGEFVRVEVRDSGPGIPPDQQKRIFEAFYRLSQSVKAAEGTGLGLAITQRLVELHGGQLGLESQIGLGSCFYFTMPIATSIEVREVPAIEARSGDGAPHIFVVEDGRTAAALLKAQLLSSGYAVTVCREPERAMEMIAELQPAAVTIDVVMKPINGWELLTTLKSDPRTAHIPAIIVSIVDQPSTGALLGADEYIVKPVERLVLLAAVERCLSRVAHVGKQSILVVDDHAPTREYIAETLLKRGFAVDTAADGAEARARVAKSLPELVILDLMLPKVSGFELLAEWRGTSRTADLPVFILTSKDLTLEERNYLQANSSSLLHKQEQWQDALFRQLQRAVPRVLVEKS
jgi:two-component system NtrC family sensor kinase